MSQVLFLKSRISLVPRNAQAERALPVTVIAVQMTVLLLCSTYPDVSTGGFMCYKEMLASAIFLAFIKFLHCSLYIFFEQLNVNLLL